MNKREKIVLILILLLALVLRLAHWLDVREDPFFAQLIMDSEEYDRWAVEIAEGDWFGSEVFFQAPLYPYFLAVVYTLFGHSLDAVYLIQIVLSLLGIYALYRAGKKIAGEKVGLIAAALSALYGVYFFYDVQLLKESLAVTLVCLLLWALVEAREKKELTLWAMVGVICGFLSLLRENMLLIIPFLILLAIRRLERFSDFFIRGLAFVLGITIVLIPVAYRNWAVGDNFLPTTFQGGVNFYIGNNPQATGTYRSLSPGKQVPAYERTEPIRLAEKEMGRTLEPYEVSNFWLRKSLDWARKNPNDFLRLQAKKVRMFWSWYEWPDAVDYYYVKQTSLIYKLPLLEFGSISLLALIGLWFVRRRLKAFFPVLLFVVMWMASTVVFFLFSRYRLPVIPGLILIGAAAVGSAFASWDQNRRQSVFVLILVVLALIAPLFVRHKPKQDLVFYNLALVYEKMGKTALAEQNYRDAFAFNSKDFLSCINLGNLAAKDKRWDEALEWYKKAEAIEPGTEGIHANIGGVYVEQGKYDEAERAFDRALEINAESVEALHNKAILLAMKKQFREASEINKRVLKLAPDWPPAIRFRERLDRILKKE
ncbi:MAG: glycosyltransferase family 39 protein [Candidatus Aminicenantes bacterium]|nr:MAG: glycosyltransferase family 39 protein [Candidatus Aminicenantes bacterium]